MAESAESFRDDAGGMADCVRQAQAGDQQALEELVERFCGPMYNLAYRMCRHPSDAEDLTQDIFVKMVRSLGSFQWRSKFSTWLYALAANVCRSGLRRRKRIACREVVHLDDADAAGSRRADVCAPGPDPAVSSERDDVMVKLDEALRGLDERYRIVIVLRDIQGLAYEEIAAVLECSLGTVKSRLARARHAVKDRLMAMGVTPDTLEQR